MAQNTSNHTGSGRKKNLTQKQMNQIKIILIAFCVAVVLIMFGFFYLVFFVLNNTTDNTPSETVQQVQEVIKEDVLHIEPEEEEEDIPEEKPQEEPEEPVEEPSVEAEPPVPLTTLDKECFTEYNGYVLYKDEQTVGSFGIDISSHQGEIEWSSVANFGVEYAIIRCGYRGYGSGQIMEDEKFYYNMTSAAENGLGLGVYFFSQALTEEEAIEEANFVLDRVAYYNIDHPIYFDWENVVGDEARTDYMSATEVTACAKAFCETIEAAGYEAGIYFNPQTVSTLLNLSSLEEYDFWLAEYASSPTFPFEVQMWQYSDKGYIDGIYEKVDLNLYFIPNED